MSDYRIEKSRCPVVVKTHGGEQIAGDMFLQLYARPGGGVELPIDVLNNHEPFFPLALHDGDTILVAKEQVVEVSTAVDADEADQPPAIARPAVIEVRLVSGEVLAGCLFLEVPLEHSRLLDFLNRADQRFLTLHGTDRRHLINRRVIERVRPLD